MNRSGASQNGWGAFPQAFTFGNVRVVSFRGGRPAPKCPSVNVREPHRRGESARNTNHEMLSWGLSISLKEDALIFSLIGTIVLFLIAKIRYVPYIGHLMNYCFY